MRSIEQLLKESERIEPVPQVVHQLMELAEDPETPISEITDLILYEPVVTANLLKLANSAAFGLKRKVDSVHDALVMLGMKQVVKLVLLGSASKPMKSARQGYGLEEGRLWKQSVSCALIASAIADAIDSPAKNIVFTAALLKDIGVIVLDRYMQSAVNQIREIMAADGTPLIEAEKEVLGIDHAHLGGRIAGNWNFSGTLAGIIENHHLTSGVSVIPEATAIVYLSDCLCSLSGINGDLFCGQDTHYERICRQVGMSEADLNRIMSDFYSRKDEIYGLLAII